MCADRGHTSSADRLAHLRNMYLRGEAVRASELFESAGQSPRADVVVGMLLPRTLRYEGQRVVEAELLRGLQRSAAPDVAASLLDLAVAHELVPDDAGRIVRAHGSAPERRLRHAAWRLAGRHQPRSVLFGLIEGASTWSMADHLTWAAIALNQGFTGDDVRTALPAAPAMAWRRQILPNGPHGLTVVQTSLRGSLFHPGQGGSGGLSVFLTALGAALAAHPAIRRVITVTLADDKKLTRAKGWFTEASDGHLILSVPDFDAGSWGPDPRNDTHPELAWWLEHLLWAHDVRPDIVHVRFSEDASWAVARSVPRLGARLAFTVTPDPHRTFFRHEAAADRRDSATYHDDLHRMFLADVLIESADVLLGLPGRDGHNELLTYFPQLRPGTLTARPVHVLREGIAPLQVRPDEDRDRGALVAQLFRGRDGLPRLDGLPTGTPLMLNVGRLHPAKQQDVLLDAWLGSALWKHTALVLIGGSDEDPTPVERDMLARIHGRLAQAPSAAGRMAVLSSLPNRQIRVLESSLEQLLPAPLPHLYVCSSVKEEFGIAILEAMDAGLLTIGTNRGGPAHYIVHRVNGFLADTSSSEALAADMVAILAPWDQQRGDRLRAIARAGQATVRRSYDIRTVGDGFAKLYTAMAGPHRGGLTLRSGEA